MSKEHLALSTLAPAPLADGDYDAICATVMASARGRWFLDEYARRNRNADTALVLAAIERLEAMIHNTQEREAHQSVRLDLLEMARTIATTRAEVAGIKPAAPAANKPTDVGTTSADVLAMAERIQDVAWTMRERGLDPATCEQIEALAKAVLSASILRNPDDHRTRKLGEVLQHLERRIARMLDAGETSPAPEGAVEPASAAELQAAAPLPANEQRFAPQKLERELAAAGLIASTGEAPTWEAEGELHEPAPKAPALLPGQRPSPQSEPEPLVVVPFPAREPRPEAAPVELDLEAELFAPEPVEIATDGLAEATPPGEQPAASHVPTAATPAAPDLAAVVEEPTAPNDPLAALRAMSPAQKIALFT